MKNPTVIRMITACGRIPRRVPKTELSGPPVAATVDRRGSLPALWSLCSWRARAGPRLPAQDASRCCGWGPLVVIWMRLSPMSRADRTWPLSMSAITCGK